ncbi:MAG TPA: hypothetical protein VGQ63_14575 [Pseudolabrys sp.]|jgi:hypothetical protein|nr:hypothetical protein [Pseudolabrys sp.]
MSFTLIDSSSTAITKGARRSFPDGIGVFRLAMLGCLFLGRGTVRIGGESSSNSQRRAMPALAGGMGVRCNRAFHGRSPAAKNGGSGYCFGEHPINKQRREKRIRTRSCAPSRSTSAACFWVFDAVRLACSYAAFWLEEGILVSG